MIIEKKDRKRDVDVSRSRRHIRGEYIRDKKHSRKIDPIQKIKIVN